MSDLPADTLTTTIAQTILDIAADHPMWISDTGQPLDYLPEREARIGDFIHEAAAAVVSVLATHNEHTAANALRDAADAAVPKFNVHPLNRSNTVRDWLLARADRLAAVSPTPPTHKEQEPLDPCPCGWSDNEHDPREHQPAPVPPTHTTTTEDQ